MMQVGSVELVLFSPDEEDLSAVRAASKSLSLLMIGKGSGPEIHRNFHLDAMWIPMMAAVDWGAPLPFPIRTGLAYPTPAGWIARGMPSWFVTGGALSDGRRPTPEQAARILTLNAVEGAKKLPMAKQRGTARVGALVSEMGLGGLDEDQVREILSDALLQDRREVMDARREPSLRATA